MKTTIALALVHAFVQAHCLEYLVKAKSPKHAIILQAIALLLSIAIALQASFQL